MLRETFCAAAILAAVACSASLTPADAADVAAHGAILTACEAYANEEAGKCMVSCTADRPYCETACGELAYHVWSQCLKDHGIEK